MMGRYIQLVGLEERQATVDGLDHMIDLERGDRFLVKYILLQSLFVIQINRSTKLIELHSWSLLIIERSRKHDDSRLGSIKIGRGTDSLGGGATATSLGALSIVCTTVRLRLTVSSQSQIDTLR
jgi:hypothetical protein